MTDKILLDTDVLVEYLRGRSQAVRYLENTQKPAIVSSITVAELFAGVRKEVEHEALSSFLDAFFIAAVDREVAELGGIYRRDYGPSHGTVLADALIAATAKVHDAMLVTFNARHFPMLDRVRAPYKRPS